MAENPQPQGERQFALRSIYIKDLSYEAPNAPEIFRQEWKPETSLHLDIKLSALAEDTHEIVLTVTVTTKVGEQTAYLIEVQQAGIISVAGFAQEELGPLFYVYCPSLLFPYARQAVSDLVVKGGFPHLVLQHVSFDAIYAQKQAEQAASGEATAAAGQAQAPAAGEKTH
ncbi:protein-export chaperone SecB [Halochromatium roseum]|uniref:protein-export chaperone SecB n=1 Tax=Halochromatium roseum TaxID=391920 RepID=UPI001912BCA1|nr:protein-export chaperone SecB [Halochromatium roseum]MBK5937937.1 protein-export chaperone SecB [Halochromatium roseum]